MVFLIQPTWHYDLAPQTHPLLVDHLLEAVQPTVVSQRVGGDLTGVRQSQETGPTDLIQSSSQLVHRQAKRCRSSLFGLQPIFPLEDIFLQFSPHTALRSCVFSIWDLLPGLGVCPYTQSTFVPGIGVPLFMHNYVNQTYTLIY